MSQNRIEIIGIGVGLNKIECSVNKRLSKNADNGDRIDEKKMSVMFEKFMKYLKIRGWKYFTELSVKIGFDFILSFDF